MSIYYFELLMIVKIVNSNENLKPLSLAHRIRFMNSLFCWSHEEGHIKSPLSHVNKKHLKPHQTFLLKELFLKNDSVCIGIL